MTTAASSGEEQLENSPLFELNKKSAALGTWILRIYNPVLKEYDYARGGEPQKGHKLTCLLISTNNNEYCAGIAKIKKKDMAGLKQLQKKFLHGSTWAFKQVHLDDNKLGCGFAFIEEPSNVRGYNQLAESTHSH